VADFSFERKYFESYSESILKNHLITLEAIIKNKQLER